MAGLLLIPYNDSMRLGQGYNSFLHTPCVYDAVKIVPANRYTLEDMAEGAAAPPTPAQTVSYSSHFVDKVSEVVRSAGVSAGSVIKSDSLGSSNTASNRRKIAESDLNLVVSVKVVNQRMPQNDTMIFQPPEQPELFFAKPTGDALITPGLDEIKSATEKLITEKKNDAWPQGVVDIFNMAGKASSALHVTQHNSVKFHEIYGDCFISGFVEGGHLHGVISMKILDSSMKEVVKTKLKKQIGSAIKDFGFNDSNHLSGNVMSQTETSVSVQWAGGSQIKPGTNEWLPSTLLNVAAAFPASVAKSPERTWAILTRYDTNMEFLAWAQAHQVSLRRYDDVHRFALDLLDMYMEYQNNLVVVDDVLVNPTGYDVQGGVGLDGVAVLKTAKALVAARREMRDEMDKIAGQIDQLNLRPWDLKAIKAEVLKIPSPEVWATRLPIVKYSSSGFKNSEQLFREATKSMLGAVKQVAQLTIPPLAPDDDHEKLSAAGKAFFDSSPFRGSHGPFDIGDARSNEPCCSLFNQCAYFEDVGAFTSWPTRIVFFEPKGLRFHLPRLTYLHGHLPPNTGHGAEYGYHLGLEERIIDFWVSWSEKVGMVAGAGFTLQDGKKVELYTNMKVNRVESPPVTTKFGKMPVECTGGLKGFYGGFDKDGYVARLKVIWGN